MNEHLEPGSGLRVVVFGANGPTGRLVTRIALDRGHDVVAVTRRPSAFPFTDPRLRVAEADATVPDAVGAVIAGADAVISALGAPFTRRPITTYSAGTRAILAGMRAHGVQRLAVVSASATVHLPQPGGGFLLNRVLAPLVSGTVGRSTYADMRRMEEMVTTSALDWTVLRPSGLFDHPQVTAYELAEDHSPGPFTSRIDLAAALVRTLTDSALSRKAVAVSTTAVRQSLLKTILREARSRP